MFNFDRRSSKESNSSEDLDAQLIQEYGFKYLNWPVKVNFELLKYPSQLEDWDIEGEFARYRSPPLNLVGHYEIETGKQGIIEGFSHFDYIDLPELNLILQLQLKPDKGKENNYGLVERKLTIPKQTLKFDNLKAGNWREGQVNPFEINLKIDIDRGIITYSKEGFELGFWYGWNDLEGEDNGY